jgi:hypothetical protein
MPWITQETRAGEAVQAGARCLVPYSKVLRLQVPGWRGGGLVWNRPVGVLVTEANGQETMLPVRDITRYVELLLLAAGLVSGLLLWSAYRSRKEK